jgi:SAM-dependent methyltransferase
VTGTGKYDVAAEGWSDEQYADSAAYLGHRAALIVALGPMLEPGDTVLDLACGDAGLAEPLLDAGLRYVGVDLSGPMVEAAGRRVGERAEILEGDLNTFVPPSPLQATTCFRAIYYAHDRRAFFSHVAAYTEKKLVFDLNPRQYPVADVRADLLAAGFDRLLLRPFFVPQTVAPNAVTAWSLRRAEQTGAVARLVLRMRFTYMCSAFRADAR